MMDASQKNTVNNHIDSCGKKKSISFFCTHLQWTTIGPALGGLDNLTLRIKERRPVAL